MSESAPPLTAYRLGAAALRHRRTLWAAPLVAGAAAVAASFAMTQQYTSRTSFIPQTGSRQNIPTAAASIATQLGLPLGGLTGTSQSPLVYVQLVFSRRVLGDLLDTRFPDPRPGPGASADSVQLIELLHVSTSLPPGRRREAGLTKLKDAISVDVDEKTTLVTVSVDSRYPRLAYQMAARIVQLLDAFNRQTRQSQAGERRRFVELRVTDVQETLRQAERALEVFYATNQNFRQAPRLVFEEARLERQLTIQQDLYLTLRREAESARLEEVNDTPLLSIVDAPAVPARRSKPNRALLLVFGVLLGAAVGGSRVVLDPALRAPLPDGVSEVDELRNEWQAFASELSARLPARLHARG